MKRATRLHRSPNRIPYERLLQQIAEAIGVDTEAFYRPAGELMFHADADGTRWVLIDNAHGSPAVRCVSIKELDYAEPDETIAIFLAKNSTSPQGQALFALIDQALSIHLRLSIRG